MLSNLHTSAMKAADKVTTIRIILAPVFFILCNGTVFFSSVLPVSTPLIPVAEFFRYCQIPLLWIVFIAAEVTDMLDGMIARKRGEVSDFGKFYDPFADTLFQVTMFFCFVWHRILPVIPFLLVLYREFAILFVRNLMQKKGISMGARMGGKIKTVVYISAGCLALAVFSLRLLTIQFPGTLPAGLYSRLYPLLSRAAVAVFLAAVLLSILSFADYVKVYLKSSRQ